MPAADEQFTKEIANLYPIPDRFGGCRAIDLLRAAALGRIGVDQRMIEAVLGKGPAGAADVLAFVREAENDDLFAVSLDDLVVDLLRHYKSPEALRIYLSLLERHEGRATEALESAVIEIGPSACEPLLDFAAGLDESQQGDIARIVAALRVRNDRVFAFLKDHLGYDSFGGALCLALYGDPKGVPLLKELREDKGVDAELRQDIDRCIQEIAESTGEPIPLPPFEILAEYDEKAPPEMEVLADEERLVLLDSPAAEYRLAVLEDMTPEDSAGPLGPKIRELCKSDPEAAVRGRAWEALAHEFEEDRDLAKKALALIRDESCPWPERAGALVGYSTAMEPTDETRAVVKQLYGAPGYRATALKAMWRSFDRTWIDYFPKHLLDEDRDVQEQAIFGVGHFGIISSIDQLEKFFGNEDLRPAALYAYALAAPGGADRARAKQILRRIEKLADGFDEEETALVEHALDQRLMQHGKQPVFHRD